MNQSKTCSQCGKALTSRSRGRICTACQLKAGLEMEPITMVEKEEQPSRIGRYRVEHLLARGGMGEVYVVYDEQARRKVALKRMVRHDNREMAVRFGEEAQITGQLEHPGIVPVHELEIGGDNPFYTMKLVEGATLSRILKLLKDGGPGTAEKYPLSRLLNIFLQVLDAISFAHSRGVVHRDLKPSNIMVGNYGEVMVMDWGLAKVRAENPSGLEERVLDDETSSEASAQLGPKAQEWATTERSDGEVTLVTKDGRVLGSPQYMSPEQARGEIDRIDECSDIFSLGCILYNILNLKKPYEGKDANEILSKAERGEITPTPTNTTSLSDWFRSREVSDEDMPDLPWEQVPYPLAAIVRKAMAFKPEDRYAAVRDMHDDIDRYQKNFLTSVENPGFINQFRLLVKRNKREALFSFLFLLFVFGGISSFIFLRTRDQVQELAKRLDAQVQASQAEMRARTLERQLEDLNKERNVEKVKQ